MQYISSKSALGMPCTVRKRLS